MSTASVTQSCPVCDQSLPLERGPCPGCRASPDWIDLLQAQDSARRRFEEWQQQGRLTPQQLGAIADSYRRQRESWSQAARAGQPLPADCGLPAATSCWSCRARSPEGATHCATCGAPLQSPGVRSLRFLTYFCNEVKRHEEAGRLGMAQADGLLYESRERLAALKHRLEKERAPLVTVAITARPTGNGPVLSTPVADAPGSPTPPRPRRNLLEILLDPRSIQWLLASGGVLLVLGLVIFLAALGIFENPSVIAICLGAATGVLLLGGWALLGYTRYQLAGRALTLLACLVMPLNLWYYHAQHILTFAPDGHLWVAAVVCCVLYAASAWVLRDPVFVYVLGAGIALTGLLILEDRNLFWEITAPSTMLVVMGLICLHTERAFPEGEGPFSRRSFGLAFFWSGHGLLAAGLLLLLGAQVVGGPLYGPIFKPYYDYFNKVLPDIVNAPWGKGLALALVLAGTYAYLYSDLVVRRVGVYIYLAAFTLLWAEVLAVNLLGSVSPEILITVLALTALAVNLLYANLAKDAGFTRAVPILGLFLTLLPVLYGVALHFQTVLGLYPPTPGVSAPLLGWPYVGALLLTVVSSRVGAHLYRQTHRGLAAAYFFATGAATLVGAAGLLTVLKLESWYQQAPCLMLIPIAYLVAARIYQGARPAAQEETIESPWQAPLVWVAHAATIVMLLSSLAAALDGFLVRTGDWRNLMLALFAAEGALFYGLAAGFRRQGFNVYLGTAMACGAVWQLLNYAVVAPDVYTLTFAALGLALLIAYRFAVVERYASTALATAAFQAANALMSLAFMASVLMTLSRLTDTQPLPVTETAVNWTTVLLLGGLGLLSLISAGLVQQSGWRRWYVVMAIAEAVLGLVTLNFLIPLQIWERVEIFCTLLGLLLLVIGHVGWYREQDRHNDLVGFSLLLGAVLMGVPLAIATLYWRNIWGILSLPNEMALLGVSMALFVTGVVLQVRATTLTGGALLGAYLVMLLVTAFGKIDGQWVVGVSLACGGGAIFLVGLLLSIYRDRLLTLPDRIKRREGVFRVLAWR